MVSVHIRTRSRIEAGLAPADIAQLLVLPPHPVHIGGRGTEIGNIPGKTQTIPTSIYYAVVTGKDEQATTLVFIMVLFSFTLVFGLNTWLKKKNYKGS